ncbi:oxygen-independent coproporphyrinogen III oxidase [Parabacteroides timonensis]|uniref:oxygen-independent coproporphyrinogen III oxidase n=1 Tax=Parabacteroides timonensis TaxID=1871013 RepID=UPI00094E7BD0|nr:oxygen-independent coproporphyrinogen III oxidase [Parabacteroides timonensis]
MIQSLLQKYNVPVPRYTSYPPANYFTDTFTNTDYEAAIEASNTASPGHISFYVHIPFCRHLCHYCGCNSFAMMNRSVVERYIEALHVEIDKVKERLAPGRKISQIHYGGGSPTAMPVYVLKELNDHLLAGFETIDQPEIAVECHPGYLDEEYWQYLTEAGFNRFSLGVQDFNEKVLKTVNRRPALLPVEMIFRILRSKGARINMDFIYGLPFQTAESFSETITRAAVLQPDRLVTFSYAHVPWVNRQQLILEKAGLPASEEKSRMFEAAKEILGGTGYKTIGLDHFVLEDDELYTARQNGQLHRNFQGYCTRRTTGQVYAFGVTGISQLSSAYTQNSKDIHRYIEQIEGGSFAIAKGYTLSRDEQITREAIETLMCNYTLNWQDVATRLACPVDEVKAATAYDEKRMREFAGDGLIEYDDDHIRMTSEGALFVRNVAASLDKLMLHSNKSFSKPV